jgi:hypothetical protein
MPWFESAEDTGTTSTWTVMRGREERERGRSCIAIETRMLWTSPRTHRTFLWHRYFRPTKCVFKLYTYHITFTGSRGRGRRSAGGTYQRCERARPCRQTACCARGISGRIRMCGEWVGASTRLVLRAHHGAELSVDREHALVRPLKREPYDSRVDVCEYPVLPAQPRHTAREVRWTHRVLSSVPSSAPNVISGRRTASGARPSRHKPCPSAA